MTNYVSLGQVGFEVNLIDNIDYLLIRDNMKWSENWLDVIAPLRAGGSRIGKHLLAETDFDWDIFIRPKGGDYQVALTKLQNLRTIIGDTAPKNAQGTSPVYYIESVAEQTSLLKYKVMSGVCVPIDRMLTQSGIIKCHLSLKFDGGPISGL